MVKFEESLVTKFPALANEWDFTKNGDLTPNDVTPFSNRKVWWHGQCGHTWQAVVASRAMGAGCPYCMGRKTLVGFNDLSTLKPDLAAEWNYERNIDVLPTDVTPSSGKKVWWKCDKGHEWQAVVRDRNDGTKCPYCFGHKTLSGFNDLATTNPEIAVEWNYKKNGDLLPSDVTPSSNRKVWWMKHYDVPDDYPIEHLRGKHFDFEWCTTIDSRAIRQHDCPYLANRKVWPGFNDLASVCPELAKEWHPTKNGDLKPCDVLPKSRLAVWWYEPSDLDCDIPLEYKQSICSKYWKYCKDHLEEK